MTHLLQINSSIFSDESQSTRMADDFVEKWQDNHPDNRVTVRDFTHSPVPHLSAESFQAFITPENERTASQAQAAAYSDGLIEELQKSDVIVLALPMYNFGIPSQLKAYFDHIARAGITFRYTENGPVGLLENKKVYVLATRGGLYAGTDRDTQTKYVTDFFNFIGIKDIEFIYAEGLNMGDDNKEAALSQAIHEISQLAA